MAPTLRCSQCKAYSYCTTQHQATHWVSGHKAQCVGGCMSLDLGVSATGDDVLYDAFSQRPSEHLYGRQFYPELVGKLPEISSELFFEWPLPSGIQAEVVMDATGKELTHQERLDVINSHGPSALVGMLRRTNTVRIAYRLYMPTGVNKTTEVSQRLLLWGMLHGVPAGKHAKRSVATELTRYGHPVLIWDMLGLGNSSKVLRFYDAAGHDITTERYRFRWDVDYVDALVEEVQKKMLSQDRDTQWCFQADDWGAATLFAYAERFPGRLRMAAAFDPVALDGWEVREIGPMGRLAQQWLDQKISNGQMIAATQAFDQMLVGIEKYMVEKRERMNRYAERDWFGPYADVDMQNGLYSGKRSIDWPAVVALMIRATVLGPPDLLPYHSTKNTTGTRYTAMKDEEHGPVPWLIGWGTLDQMMPAVQRHSLARLLRAACGAQVVVTAIDGANHFVESDRPRAVVAAMLDAEFTLLSGPLPIHAFLGNEGTPKGDELEKMQALDTLAGVDTIFIDGSD